MCVGTNAGPFELLPTIFIVSLNKEILLFDSVILLIFVMTLAVEFCKFVLITCFYYLLIIYLKKIL